MKALTKGGVIWAAIAVVSACLGVDADASLIDLGQLNITTWIAGLPAAQKLTEKYQGPAHGSLTYLNSFDAKSGTLGDRGTVGNDHFAVTLSDGGIDGNITWDLAATGFQLSYVFVKDARDAHNPSLFHLYGVTSDEVVNGNGNHFVTINGARDITYIAFFGVAARPVPEAGVTLWLLALGLGLIGIFRRLS